VLADDHGEAYADPSQYGVANTSASQLAITEGIERMANELKAKDVSTHHIACV
jgi:hypothetical protein